MYVCMYVCIYVCMYELCNTDKMSNEIDDYLVCHLQST